MHFQQTLFLLGWLALLATAAPSVEVTPRGIIGNILGKVKTPQCVCPKVPKPSTAPVPVPAPIEMIATNQCSTGTPYCCSGDNVIGINCGPASTTNCQTLTICCINTNGMQFCAGSIDFSGPITINHNVNIGCNGKRQEYR